jgi:tRNA 2-thiouridine synthesizing protein A
MAKTLDARGLSCPQPVLMALKEMKAGETSEMIILVDTDTARENVFRAATSQGWVVADIGEDRGGFKITVKKGSC